jgi:CubicO group peptidase (beta-lactamase class C family)
MLLHRFRSRHLSATPATATVFFALLSLAARADDAQFAALDEQMQAYVDQGQISGAVTLVGERGRVLHVGTVGLADVDAQTPMTGDTLFGIMSMTKPITATAVMILADEGKLAIDDPVEKYIPAFARAKLTSGEPVSGLTIRRLLTHTSGLTGDQRCETTLEATAEMLAKRPFGFQPGTKWEYGPSMNVCGRIVEIASGQSFDEFLAARIFRPLAMDHTTFYPTPAQWERVATLYRFGDDGKSLVKAERWAGTGSRSNAPNPSGGLFATAGDMFRFYQLILHGGEWNGQRIVSQDAVREMTSVQTPDLPTGFTPGNGWGLGWCIVREPQAVTAELSPGTFGHGGAWGTQGWVDPLRERVFVLMIQRADLGNSDGSEIRKEFHRLAVEALESN